MEPDARGPIRVFYKQAEPDKHFPWFLLEDKKQAWFCCIIQTGDLGIDQMPWIAVDFRLLHPSYSSTDWFLQASEDIQRLILFVMNQG